MGNRLSLERKIRKGKGSKGKGQRAIVFGEDFFLLSSQGAGGSSKISKEGSATLNVRDWKWESEAWVGSVTLYSLNQIKSPIEVNYGSTASYEALGYDSFVTKSHHCQGTFYIPIARLEKIKGEFTELELDWKLRDLSLNLVPIQNHSVPHSFCSY